jgi:hypothetical protein
MALISLAAAAAIVHKQATGRIAENPAVIDEVSAAIAKHVSLYARKGWGDTLAIVPADELKDAVFMQGGELMRSQNVTYTSLCIREGDLPTALNTVVERLK